MAMIFITPTANFATGGGGVFAILTVFFHALTPRNKKPPKRHVIKKPLLGGYVLLSFVQWLITIFLCPVSFCNFSVNAKTSALVDIGVFSVTAEAETPL